jgi:hypothetical protein
VIDDVRTTRPLIGFLEIGKACLDREERPFEIGVDHLVPLVRAEIFDLHLREDAGIGTENIDAAECLGCRRCCLFHRSEIGDISDYRVCTVPDFGCRTLSLFKMARDHGDAGPGICQGLGDTLADPLAATGDNRASPFDRVEHRGAPFIFRCAEDRRAASA